MRLSTASLLPPHLAACSCTHSLSSGRLAPTPKAAHLKTPRLTSRSTKTLNTTTSPSTTFPTTSKKTTKRPLPRTRNFEPCCPLRLSALKKRSWSMASQAIPLGYCGCGQSAAFRLFAAQDCSAVVSHRLESLPPAQLATRCLQQGNLSDSS